MALLGDGADLDGDGHFALVALMDADPSALALQEDVPHILLGMQGITCRTSSFS